jgi:hypothetical protein
MSIGQSHSYRSVTVVRKIAQIIPWLEKLTASLALLNLILVMFDLSYIPWRDVYLQRFPGLTTLYDPLKGIEPHRETQGYLKTVQQLEQRLAQVNLQDAQVQSLLSQLREQSTAMIRDNPFQLANKTGTLERIKNKMRQHMNNKSATQSFNTLLSVAHLSQAGWEKEFVFFNQQIRPLIATNYFRHYGENGDFIDRFWQIDSLFIAFFGLEFLVRTYFLSRHRTISWIDAMLWRWYDIFLLLPVWQYFRVIPVMVRLDQAGLVNLEHIRLQINRGVATSLGAEMTSLVVVRVLNLAQDTLRRGDALRAIARLQLSRANPNQPLNKDSKLDDLLLRILQVGVHQVIPKIQPDLVALVSQVLENALQRSLVYQGVQQIPVVGELPKELAQQLVGNLSQALYDLLSNSLEDPEIAQIAEQLTQHLSEALRLTLHHQNTVQDIQWLIAELLEEVKLQYLQQSTDADHDQASI